VRDLLALTVVLSLASWRLSSLLYNEDPLGWLRRLLGIVELEDGTLTYPENVIGATFSCFWCLSLVVALPVALLCGWLAELAAWSWPVLWLASAAGTIWMEKWTGRSKARW
jgi:hypothetical protein